MAESLSTKDRPRRLARRRPTVDLPTPMSPTSTIGRSRRFDNSVTVKGYTAARALGKSRAMPRLLIPIVLVLVVLGVLFFLSTLPKEQPTKPIEVAVPQGAGTGGNAH